MKEAVKKDTESLRALVEKYEDSFFAEKEKLVELEVLAERLYKNIFSLRIVAETIEQAELLKPTGNNDKADDSNEELVNQLTMEFFADNNIFQNLPNATLPDVLGDSKEEQISSRNIIKIGVNDKFRFIKELFNNNSQEYNIAMSQLGTITHKEEALRYIDSLKDIYNWDNKKECLAVFLETIEKRFR